MTTTYKYLFLFLTAPFLLYSQSNDIKFEHISIEQGLSHEKVQCIIQDTQGFLWIATDDGLSKYDGYQFTTYRHDPEDSTSLSSNFITSLFEDRSGTIWIGTSNGGLNKFDKGKETFTQFRYDRKNPFGIISNHVSRIVEFQCEGKMVLWIGTNKGLTKMDISTQIFTYYPHTKIGYPFSYIESMVVDSSGIVWTGTSEGGLHKFDPETEQYIHYRYDPDKPFSLSDDRVMSLCIDKAGILWVGTGRGLNKFDQRTERFIRYQHDPNNRSSLSSNWVEAIYEDRQGILWIGTVFTGLNIFDRKSEQFIRYQNDPGDPNSLCDNTVRYIYEDNSDVIWVGTWGGLSKIDPGKTQFSEYKKIPGNPNSLSSSYTGPVIESSFWGKQILWIGTKKGLNKIDRATGEYTHYQHGFNNLKSIPSNSIISILEDRSGILWIGTYDDGLIKFDCNTEQFSLYVHDWENPNTISCNIINSIFEDRIGNLWISTRTGGLNKFDRETEQFKLIGKKMTTKQVYEDKTGILWMATTSGLKKLDRETEEFISYWHNPEDSNSISSNSIITIFESKLGGKDDLWFGTEGGLNKFDRKTGQFTHFTVDDGLPNNVINGILEDTNANLWLSTNSGLSRFDPKTNSFRNYGIDDGLPGIQFWPGGCFKSTDGEMFFCSSKGVVAFYPDRLVDNLYIPEIVITGFQIFNKQVAIKKGDNRENKSVSQLPKHISLIEEIELSYNENAFSFEFAALDYRSPMKNQYGYILDGFEKNWNFINAKRRFVTYTNIDPGEYILKVKGSNNDGLWNEQGTSIKITITPPWWRTSWAYSVYVFLFAVMLYVLRAYDQKRQSLKHDLEVEHLHAEKLEEMDRMKSSFFANISHEFRTPLTLIKGPIKQMLKDEFIGNVKEQYKMILHNSDRLLSLITQLLDLSKLESGRMKVQATRTDIFSFLKGVVHSFSSLAESKKISLKFISNDKSIDGYIDRDKVEKIIFNLLSNAFKFTPEGGEIISECGFKHKKEFQITNYDFVEIKVTNTGPGIPADQLEKIFDRFYQADTTYIKESEGSGIGLALTKELVELHHGEIHVSCKEYGSQVLTSFFIRLPIAEDQFKPTEITEEPITAEKVKFESKGITERISQCSPPENTMLPSKKSAPLLLIVEDNLDVANYVSSFLDRDYRIITAINGKDGWKKSINKYPDLVISDVMMPEMDGFELCKKLKTDQRTSHIPVVLLTAKADLDSKIEGLEFGADDYIGKPFEADELKVRVKNLIEIRHKLKLMFQNQLKINPKELAVSALDEKFLEKIYTIIEKHLDDTHLTVEQLANESNMSHRNLNRKLKVLTGYSARKFISTMRLKRAAQLLQNNSDTVSQIAYQVGFRNLSYFTKIFRHQFSTTPSQYRNHSPVSS